VQPSAELREALSSILGDEGYESVAVSSGEECLALLDERSIDLVLLDGAKGLYSIVLSLLEPRLRTGALIVADNADWSPEYLARVRDPECGYVSVPFASDVELSMKLRGNGDGL